MADETVDLIEETNDEEESWVYYAKEQQTEDEHGNDEQDLIFMDPSELVANDNVVIFQCNGNVDTNELVNNIDEEQSILNNDDMKEEEVDCIDDLSKHSLILRETIDENGQLVEGYFCQQCNCAFNSIEDFLSYHPCSEMLIETTSTEQQQTDAIQQSTEDDLWDLAENLDEAEENGTDVGMELKPNVNNVDMDKERYFCYDCRQVFTDLSTAENHDCTNEFKIKHSAESEHTLLVDSSDNNIYRCYLCDKDYTSLRSFNNHQRWHKKSAEQLGHTKTLHKVEAECEICNTVFASEKNLKLHMKMHKKHAVKTIQDALPIGAQSEYNELNQFFCEICNKSFDQKLLVIHKNMHQNVEEYVCGKCNKQFENLPSYEIHLQMHADNMTNVKKISNFQKVTVTLDGPSISSQSNTAIKDGKRKHACQYCGKEFKRPYEKVKHERIHTGEKPYECEVCGKTFRVSYSLTLHLRTHTDIRPYVCATCNKRFKQQSVYVHHMKTHINERGYKCDICGKSFRTSVQLSGHKNIHSKPYNCIECNRPFASLYAVKIHMKTHNKSHKSNKNLKNRCNICGASYARLFALRLHIKEQHGIDVDPTQLLETENSNGDTMDKGVSVETAILMNATNETSKQQMNYIINELDEDSNEHNIVDDIDDNDEVPRNQVDHEENIENPLSNTVYLDEAEAATQTILNTEEIAAHNFHAEEIITDWLSEH